ncbi:hypothetical protein, partial [Liquorilactobacillus satsumensis]|uniref:hypothetical protein n=1 Tax=Liquorilactobacillus satsumensis TaxID=259059 RepID=UPI0039E7DFEA
NQQPPMPKPALRVTKSGLFCKSGLSLWRLNAGCRYFLLTCFKRQVFVFSMDHTGNKFSYHCDPTLSLKT